MEDVTCVTESAQQYRNTGFKSGGSRMRERRNRQIVQALRNELSFLRLRGYGLPFGNQWRPTLIFRDSPLCMNFDSSAPHQPCERCPLFEFVPIDKRQAFMPCHQIALNE